MKLPKNLTLEEVMEGARNSAFGLDNTGYCLACGEETQGVEPDAEGYECECCGEPKVYGAEQIVLMLA